MGMPVLSAPMVSTTSPKGSTQLSADTPDSSVRSFDVSAKPCPGGSDALSTTYSSISAFVSSRGITPFSIVGMQPIVRTDDPLNGHWGEADEIKATFLPEGGRIGSTRAQ